MTNKDHISIDTRAPLGLEKTVIELMTATITRMARDSARPRTIAAIARALVIERRKLARWLKKLDINIHEC